MATTDLTPEPRRSELGGELHSKVVTWETSARTAELAASMTGLEFLQGIVDGRHPAPPFADLIGARLIEVELGRAVFACVLDESLLNLAGISHGGVLASLMDCACGSALHSHAAPGTATATIEMKVNYLHPVANGQRIEVTGRTIRVGRRIAFIEGEARTENDLVGTASMTMAVQRVGSDSASKVR